MSFSNLYEYMHGEFQDVTRVMLNASGVDSVWIIDPNGVKIAGHTIELWDAETGGTQLIEGVDYSLVFLDTGKTAAEGVDIWAGYQVLNVAYQGIPLYITARIIGGYTLYQDAGALNLPIGYTYTQLPGKLDPIGLGLVGTWTDISDEFAGNFFRVAGGNAGPFDGSVQEDSFQNFGIPTSINDSPGDCRRITNQSCSGVGGLSTTNVGVTYSDTVGQGGSAALVSLFGDVGEGTPRRTSETRPINQTIQIWERTA